MSAGKRGPHKVEGTQGTHLAKGRRRRQACIPRSRASMGISNICGVVKQPHVVSQNLESVDQTLAIMQCAIFSQLEMHLGFCEGGDKFE